MKPRHARLTGDCQSIHEILGRVGDKWTVLVVGVLGDGPKRFSELRRTIDGISQKMLTTTLRTLERDGFCTRTVFPTVPPRVDYALTELGRDLLVPVAALAQWTLANRGRIDAARRRFDGRDGAAEAGAAEAVPEPAGARRATGAM